MDLNIVTQAIPPILSLPSNDTSEAISKTKKMDNGQWIILDAADAAM
jgi:hypothetical protein